MRDAFLSEGAPMLSFVLATAFAQVPAYGPASGASPAAGPLGDLISETSRKRCDMPRNIKTQKPHPGAEQVYTGGYQIGADGIVKGYERRYLYANDLWKQKKGLLAGKDCVDVWTVRGKKTVAKNCPTCEFGIEITADIDKRNTTCERRLTAEDGNHFSIVYGIDEKADGSLSIHFPSGKTLGKGRKQGEQYMWKTEQTCVWF